jgi:hypothetical protein
VVDPYDWLGLPKEHRPPTLYQLLGLEESVDDAGVIRAATDRRFRTILPHLTGPHPLEAEQLWAELEDARDTLLDPDRRAHYDAQAGPSPLAEEPPPSSEPATPAETPISPDELAAATLPDPEPWWKTAPEAPSGTQAWWQQPLPLDRPAPPPPVAVAPAKPHVHAEEKPDPLVPDNSPRRRSAFPVMLAGGIIVVGLISAGMYYAFGRKVDTAPGPEQPMVESPKSDPKPKTPGRVGPKVDDSGTQAALPRDFADKLRPRTYTGHEGAVGAIAIASNGSRFATVGVDRTLRIWSIVGDESTIRHSFSSPAVGVAWHGGDRRLTAADGFSLGLFDAMKATSPRLFDTPRSGVSALAITPDGTRALTGLTDGSVRVWDTASGRADEWPVASRGPVTAVDVSSDGAQALVAVADGPVSVWNLARRQQVHEWNSHSGGAVALRFSPDGTRAATAGPDGTLVIHDLGAKKEICRRHSHVGAITGIAWLPDGRQVVTAGVDGKARLWSAETGYPLRWLQSLDGKGSCVAVDAGGRFVLVGTSAGAVQLFPLPRVRPETLTGATGKPPAEPLAIPDSDAVASAMTAVRDELAREFAYNRPDDMALLADKLRLRAGMERVSSALRFGLLQQAMALALKAGDVVTAFQAIDDLAAWFDVDELAAKAETLAELPAEADAGALLELGLAAAERAEIDARPEVVSRILQRLAKVAVDGAPADRVARLDALRKRAAAVETELTGVRRALAILKNAPDDQGSNHTLGMFLCLARQDWSTGLPHLARGTDPRFIDAAKLDLSAPVDPKGQHRVGETWYGLAIDAKDHRARRAMLGRARTWFEREAKAKLETADAVKVRARLDDIAKLDVPGKDPSALPLYLPAPVRRAYNTIGRDVCRNEWRLDGGAEPRADGVLLPEGSPVLSSRFGLAAGGRLTLSFRPDGREIRINCAGQEFAFGGSGKSLRVMISRTEANMTVSASADGGEPVARTADVPANIRGPIAVTIRLTGTPSHTGGAMLHSAIVRGPASLTLPFVE